MNGGAERAGRDCTDRLVRILTKVIVAFHFYSEEG